MTHDPLCPQRLDGFKVACACRILAQARAEEKAKWTHVCPDKNCCHGTPE
jgi:hypothetical protein